MDYSLVHYQPLSYNSNVRCLNGSAHIRRTTDYKQVTCALCKDPRTNAAHWAQVREEFRTKHTQPPIWRDKEKTLHS